MRLFYQTLGMSRGSKSGRYGQVLTEVIQGAAAPGTTIDIFGLTPHRAVADQYRYLEFLDTAEVIENGLRAQAEGYDAFLIGNFFQPGLHELRELLAIPVLGLAESSVSMACLMGPTFSLINVNPKFNRRIVEGITLQGLAGRMTSVEMLTVERPGVFDLALQDTSVRDGIVAQFIETARRALDKGAEVLIPAGGSLMAALLQAALKEVAHHPDARRPGQFHRLVDADQRGDISVITVGFGRPNTGLPKAVKAECRRPPLMVCCMKPTPSCAAPFISSSRACPSRAAASMKSKLEAVLTTGSLTHKGPPCPRH